MAELRTVCEMTKVENTNSPISIESGRIRRRAYAATGARKEMLLQRHIRSGYWISTIVILCIATLAQASGDSALPNASRVPIHLPEGAMGRDVLVGDVAQIEARLLVSSGPKTQVGVLFDLAEGWHLYWRNPGDTGLAPVIDIEVPNRRVGPVVWPAPTVFEEADGLFTTYGYDDQVLLGVPLREHLEPQDQGAATLVRANARVLVCRTECVPASFSLSSPITPVLSAQDQAHVDSLFADANARSPISIDELPMFATARWSPSPPEGDEATGLELTLAGCETDQGACDTTITKQATLPFLPFEDQAFELTGFEVVSADDAKDGGKIEMEAVRVEAGNDRIRGLLLVEDRNGRIRHLSIDVPIESAKTQRATPAVVAVGGDWFQIFLLALLGGLILNAMPCVLPVLAIKVVAIADLSEKNPRDVRTQGLAYTGGVLGSMAILAAVVISLRSAGHSVGWGFQFQEPLFVASISAVLVAFALNLFGVYEIDFGQGRLAQVGTTGSDTRRSVFEGLLAVVLATPCTAPFLGTAVGFAFAASDFSILTIFLAIGLGLALPFLAVSFAPGLARFIPRSGPWMLKLRAGLGFSLLAAVVWLLWVVGQSGGTDAVIGLAAMLLLFAFVLWMFGQAQPLENAWLARGGALAIAGLAFAGFNLIEFEAPGTNAPLVDATDGVEAPPNLETGWSRYSEQAVAAALAEGRPAFVVFTADWCITCKLNEKTVLNRAAVRDAFAAGNYALFKADWTRRDEEIRVKLSEFGRAGVPLYLVYSPEAPKHPEVLSELLSQNDVRAALARSAPSDRG
jgi:thiol:disulfide interchange protein